MKLCLSYHKCEAKMFPNSLLTANLETDLRQQVYTLQSVNVCRGYSRNKVSVQTKRLDVHYIRLQDLLLS